MLFLIIDYIFDFEVHGLTWFAAVTLSEGQINDHLQTNIFPDLLVPDCFLHMQVCLSCLRTIKKTKCRLFRILRINLLSNETILYLFHCCSHYCYRNSHCDYHFFITITIIVIIYIYIYIVDYDHH